MILSLVLFGCSSFNHKAIKTTIDNYKKTNTVFYFDPFSDYPIDKNDPRIKSIIYNINQKSLIKITYCNNRTKFMANNYQKFLNLYTNKILIEKIRNLNCKLIELEINTERVTKLIQESHV